MPPAEGKHPNNNPPNDGNGPGSSNSSDDNSDGSKALWNSAITHSIHKGLSGLFANIDDNKETAWTSNPEPFDSSNAKALNIFFTACATMFIGMLKAYKKQCSCVTYALSFLWGPARDHFALLISEADNTGIVPLIFENWPLFKAELTSNFGPINSMADAESTINKLSLAEDGKGIKYFVEFNKYKSRTRFNDWAITF